MDIVGRSQLTTILKKGKKKHAKDELDRLKQAEKKKRCLENVLEASAAICSELEKKKQKKFEEQRRLDKEGAATIANEENSNLWSVRGFNRSQGSRAMIIYFKAK